MYSNHSLIIGSFLGFLALVSVLPATEQVFPTRNSATQQAVAPNIELIALQRSGGINIQLSGDHAQARRGLPRRREGGGTRFVGTSV